MAAELPSPCCMRGSLHNGNPTGTEETIHGLQTYVARPETGPTKGTLVIIPDAFGWDFVNLRVLADSYAKRGKFEVLMPDFHFGDPFTKSGLDSVFALKGYEPPFYVRWYVCRFFHLYQIIYIPKRTPSVLYKFTKFNKINTIITGGECSLHSQYSFSGRGPIDKASPSPSSPIFSKHSVKHTAALEKKLE
ncbi:hypothetical protein TWF694_004879 [Orbilia ellipsospora]|uniref:Dienelactone hydrolase domain-containing protein n=1 Tax=Orbilia ellipsospora TaxID=2528407 RepID=A0AAV9WW03_9PEZI